MPSRTAASSGVRGRGAGTGARLVAGAFSATGFRVEAAGNVAVAVQVDGDRAGRLPIEVEIIPSGLKLLVSARGADRLGVPLPNN